VVALSIAVDTAVEKPLLVSAEEVERTRYRH